MKTTRKWTNEERASLVYKVMKVFVKLSGDNKDDEMNAVDLLTDIFHYLDQRNIPREPAIALAPDHFVQEKKNP